MTSDASSHTSTLSSEQSPPAGDVEVRVTAGPDRGLSHSFREGTVVVGTKADCDVVLSDPAVSRRHASIELLSGRLRVRDLGSKNGTSYLGARFETLELPLEGSIALGATTISFRCLHPGSPLDGAAPEGLIGVAAPMRRLFAQVRAAARSDAPVLIVGETGTGKDVVAQAVHRLSERAQGPWCVLDCGSTSRELLPAALFGHVRGAFTGANRPAEGLLSTANGGTLFLDEVGELPLDLQPVLLRTLETKTFLPLGATSPATSNFRVIAATHRELGVAGAAEFRSDLYFRLSSVVLRVPPLRERLEDVPLLAQQFARELGANLTLSSSSIARLCSHRWPGNVRELKNVVQRAIALGTEAQPQPGELPPAETTDFHSAREDAVRAFEKGYLLWLLDKHKGSRGDAAKEAGIARSYFYRLLATHGLGKDPR